MSTIGPTDVPIREFRVRRRRMDGGIVLAQYNYFCELDDVADFVWKAADGNTPVSAIADGLAALAAIDVAAATDVVAVTVESFEEMGVVRVARAAAQDGEDVS